MKNFKEDLVHVKGFAFDVDGVLSCHVVPMFPNGEPMRTANIKDGYVIQLAVKLGYHIAIITGGKTEAVLARYKSLGVQDIFVGQSEKTEAYKEWRDKYGMSDSEIMYMGDDMPDLPVLRMAGMPVCPADAASDVKAECRYVSPYNGGECCVRDVMEQVLRAQNNWGKDLSW